jgi:hypothetical protein
MQIIFTLKINPLKVSSNYTSSNSTISNPQFCVQSVFMGTILRMKSDYFPKKALTSWSS